MKYEVSEITPIGITNWRNTHQCFGIKDADRLRHIYVIGKTGVGKSTLLQAMAISDIKRGNGLCVIDPHSDTVTTLLQHIQDRKNDLVLFDATDSESNFFFNPLYNIPAAQQAYVAASLIATFKKIWHESWGPRLEYILHYTLLTLLEYGGTSLLDVNTLLTDKAYRDDVVFFSKHQHIRAFWHNEFDKYSPATRQEVISSVLNKTGVFVSNQTLRNIVGKQQSIDMRQIIDERKILLCNLSKGILGEEVSSILGSMILTAIQFAILQRAAIPVVQRVPFYMYVDEMHSFVTLSFADLLAEARKFGLALFLTHQYLDQIDEKVRTAIFGNVGTIICFRLGASDAEVLAKEFYPVFSISDIINLPKYSMYIKLMIDGVTSKPFSADTVEEI